MKTITKLSKAKFKITTDNVPNSAIELDFNPIIDTFKLKGSYSLLHWQAKPKGHRQWGVYSSLTDSYVSVADVDLNFGKIKTLQLNDATAATVPSAVLHYPDGKLCQIGDKVILGEMLITSLS